MGFADANDDSVLVELSTSTMRSLFRALDCAVEELGPNTPIRQVMVLLLVAMANKGNVPLGVRDIDRALGDLPSGTASKLMKTMMHVEGDRKAGVANTIRAERDPQDLRRWDLFLTAKGAEALTKIIHALEVPGR
jgi:DNA-binding MarR family transcriptional regulator